MQRGPTTPARKNKSPTKKASQLPSNRSSTTASRISQNGLDMVIELFNSQKIRSLVHCISQIPH